MAPTLLRHLFATCILLAGLIPAAFPAQASKKVALVIGNGAYAEAPLKNPANDARAVAATLRAQGFEVLLKENAGRAQLLDAVSDFGEKLSEGDTALFFFAGHGMQVQGRNYLIPTDAKITSEQRVRLETLDVEAVLDQMSAARVRVSMVILDACRNNPFERRFRSAGGGLAQVNAPEGTMIAYATSPGKIAADGEGANGLYTQELLKALRQPGLKVEDVFKQVRIGVSRASNGAQVPWEASSLTGDFFFQPAVATAPVAGTDHEVSLWNSVRSSENCGDLQSYLDAYPGGAFATIARARIASLATAAAPVVSASRAPVAAATAARAGAEFNGTFAGVVMAGVLLPRQIQFFVSIERGELRVSGNTGGALSQQVVDCRGGAVVYADGVVDDGEIFCDGGGLQAKYLIKGVATAGKNVVIGFQSPDGKSREVVFK